MEVYQGVAERCLFPLVASGPTPSGPRSSLWAWGRASFLPGGIKSRTLGPVLGQESSDWPSQAITPGADACRPCWQWGALVCHWPPCTPSLNRLGPEAAPLGKTAQVPGAWQDAPYPPLPCQTGVNLGGPEPSRSIRERPRSSGSWRWACHRWR